jgi:lysine 2,3-aminomutase
VLMTFNEDFLYRPRKYNTIELWKDVTPEQWNDPAWQRKNSIRSVDQLKKVIRLTDHQEAEIRRTIGTLRQEGKEPLRITPYYASLVQKDPFSPVFSARYRRKGLILFSGRAYQPLQT